MKTCKLPLLWVLCFCVASIISVSAQTTQSTLPIAAHGTINFSELAQKELLNPPSPRRLTDVEDKDDNLKGIIRYHTVPANATVTRIVLPTHSYSADAVLTTSPAPLAAFNGLIDNNTEIPPDVMGVAGPNYLFETLNSQYEIFNKSGSVASTLSLASFWSGVSSSGTPFCDPHTEYDATSGHWFSVLLANLSNGDYGIFIAVSKTSDPTGAWNEYSIDTQSKTTLPDYPMMGYSSTWVAITVNNFANGASFSNVGIFMMSKSSLISGAIGTVTKTTDANLFAVSPAQTMDASQSTLYMLSDYNGSSGGNGYVELCTVTGTTTPVYAEVGTIGVNQPWSETVVNAKQKGTSNTISTDDTRMHDVFYRNGSLWATQNAYLPSTSPKRSSVQWWQINPTNSTVTQFGRIDDASGVNFYYYPGIAIDANNDVLLGYTNSSTTLYASGAYSYHAASDAAGTMETQDTYGSGLASYYKTFGGTSNRWGDFSASSIDPSDGSFWTLQEFAYTPANTWGTTWAHVASGGATCAIPTGMTTGSIANTSATFSWSAVTGAASYNVQYRVVGTTTWSTANTTTASYNATGLTSGTNYEWQVQTVCSAGGSSSFTASTDFTTTAPVCNAPIGMTTGSIANNSATFSWTAVTGAASYNVQYRVVGTTTWSTANTTTASYNASGLTAGTNYEWQVQTVCSAGGSSSFTASTDFTTTGTPPCNTPTGMTTGSITTTSATFTWSAVSGASSYNIQYRVVGTTTWSTGTSATASFPASGLTASTNYEWQVQTVCSAGGTSSFTASTDFTTSSSVTYCASSGSTQYEYINNVTLGTINNTSGNNNGYGNYTNLSTNLTGGTAYSIKLTPGFTGAKYGEYWTVYIDYNHDGTLNGTGEQVAEVHSTTNGAAVSKSFTVPTTAKNGTTRLRVQMHYGSYSTNPCATLDFGEVEDYTVNITGGTNVALTGVSNFSNGISSLQLYPNPAQNELNMQFSSDANYDATVSVYNSIGQKVMSMTQNITQGSNALRLTTTALSSGLYVLEIESNGQKIMQKFNVQK